MHVGHTLWSSQRRGRGGGGGWGAPARGLVAVHVGHVLDVGLRLQAPRRIRNLQHPQLAALDAAADGVQAHDVRAATRQVVQAVLLRAAARAVSALTLALDAAADGVQAHDLRAAPRHRAGGPPARRGAWCMGLAERRFHSAQPAALRQAAQACRPPAAAHAVSARGWRRATQRTASCTHARFSNRAAPACRAPVRAGGHHSGPSAKASKGGET